jgi:uncharacterized protein (TIGR00297 family)
LETELFLVIIFIGFVAISAKFSKLLSLSGAAMAFFTGLFIWAGFGLGGLILLGIFFLTSSSLSKYKRNRKGYLEELHAKGSERDWAQVAANGGTAALAGIANFLSPDPVWHVIFSISLASANADTWASEIGVLSKTQPLSIGNFKRVPRGTSGAVSGLGTIAAAAGSLLIAISALFLFSIEWESATIIFLLGFAGSLLDTLLGAHYQARFKCAGCGLSTEKTFHCSRQTAKVSGYSWLNNDAVNFLSCFIASLMGMVIYKLFL